MLEVVLSDPLLIATVAASLFGIVIYTLYYDSVIRGNYSRIKWVRRTIAPHISYHLKNEEGLYVETEVADSGKVLDLEVPEGEVEDVLSSIEDILKSQGFRPEVILASVGTTEDGYREIGNWVLTGPERKRTSEEFFFIPREVVRLVTSTWQLHLRIFYDEDDERLEFYVHYEYNPYCPPFAKKHFKGVGMDIEKGKQLFFDDVYPKIYGEFIMHTPYSLTKYE